MIWVLILYINMKAGHLVVVTIPTFTDLDSCTRAEEGYVASARPDEDAIFSVEHLCLQQDRSPL